MTDKRYTLQKPRPKHPGFTLVCYVPESRTKKTYHPLIPSLKSALEGVNRRLLANELTEAQAELLLRELIQSEYRKSGGSIVALKSAALSETNLKVLSRFWAEVYEVKYLADPSSARYDFERAFKAIEPLALQVASEAELTKQLRKKLSPKRIRRVVARLNEVLKWLGRDLKLKAPPEPKASISHIRLKDFKSVLPHFECEACRALGATLFGSGLRIGEAMALEPSDLDGLSLYVDKQKTAYGEKELKAPKRGKVGWVVVLPEFQKGLQDWLLVSDKWAHRWHFNDALAQACAKEEAPSISAHDLRHSHAIHLLTLGATLTDVSNNLRNRIEVCQKFYTGYAHTEGTLERLKRLTKG